MKCKNCVRHVHLNDDGERTIGTPNWCFYLSDSPDEELERDCKAFKCSTNADRIRAMTDEELADKFEEIQLQTVKAYGNDDLLLKGELKKYWLDWLRREAMTDG